VSAVAFIESNTTGTGALFVRAASRLGYWPVLLTADPARYRFAAAGQIEVRCLDTQDPAALLAGCRRLDRERGLAGVASSSEYFVASAAALAERLRLPGPSATAVAAARDKPVQRDRLAAAGVPVPGFEVVGSPAAAVTAAGRLGLPVVVKPVSGTGSVGVRLCTGAAEVAAAAAAILDRRHNERGIPEPARLLVEELAVGPEFSVELFNGAVVGVTRKYLGSPPAFVETGHDFPAALPEAAERALAGTALAALRALGLRWGPAHVELRLTGASPVVIEVNPRLAGGFIPELIRLAWGIDLVALTLAAVVGEEARPACSRRAAAAIRFLLATGEGTLASVLGREDAAREPGVASVEIYTPVAGVVRRQGDFRDRLGHVISTAATTALAAGIAERARDAIRLVVQPAGAVS
jgi:biotin carboxylase